MKKILAAVALTMLFASTALAAPTVGATAGVRGSVHDMNNLVVGMAGLGTITADPQGRVCAFCHTPHHALSDVNFDYAPLWSHQFTALTNVALYTGYASPTFDAAKIGAVDSLYGPSRLCMSCHDGVVAVDQHYNLAGNAPSGLLASDSWDGKAIGLGGSFGNDHPIGFDVVGVVAADLGIKPAIITAASPWQGNLTKNVRSGLYDPTGTGATLFMTCATCHDVHNKDNVVNGVSWDAQHADTVNGNYLVFAPQSGSQLCLTCHDK
jgi:hypothetical protein